MPYDVGDFYKTGFSAWLNGQLGLIIRYYFVQGKTGVSLSDSQVAEGLHLFLSPLIADCMAADAESLGVAVRNISNIPAEAFAISTSAAVPGTVTGNEMPTQASGIITMYTAFRGRSRRGRSYIPFPAVADNDVDGRPDTSYMTALTTLAAAMIAPVTITVGADDVTLLPVIRSAVLGTSATIVAATARRAWATQRRRGIYGQSNPRSIAPV